MVSVISNNDLDLDRNPKGVEENDVVFDCSNEQIRVWHGDDVNSSGGLTGSDEIMVCKTEGVRKDKKVDFLDGNDDSDNVGVEEVRGLDVDMKGIDEKIKTGKQFSDENGGSERLESCVNSGEDTESTSGGKGKIDNLVSRAGRGHLEVEKSSVFQYDSMLSMSDEFASTGRDGSFEKPPGYGFEIGDMVWGKVKSHPWWPGHIYSEKFASPTVRRLKRDGYVLVAFFGDSSYGWFDPAELIPFDSSFSDKLRQTSSRTFVKAVEEAVDEANRRRGLGLACRCRNPYNFRTTTVQGYFVVDINDYDPGTIYSAEQIRKSRESFQPRGMLAFIKQLALSPTGNEHGAIQFMKNKATVLAYRKAVYEEFDDTYAQAFGHQPVRPSRGQTQDMNQPFKVPTRAPLSGPLVIAEALGKGKGKFNKGKDQAKKDRYLFKRRDEPNELKTSIQINPSQEPVYVEGALPVADGDYVLQKRSPLVSAKHKVPEKHGWTETIAGDGVSDLSREVTSDEGRTMNEKSFVMTFSMADSRVHSSKVKSPASSPLGQDQSQIIHPLEARFSLDKGKDVGLEIEAHFGSDVGVGRIGRNTFDSVGDVPLTLEPSVVPIDSKDDNASSTDFKVEGFEESLSQPAKIELRGEQAQDVFTAEHPLGTSNAKSHGEGPSVHTDIGAKKAKVRKHPVGELSSENSIPLKKKKQKKEQMSSPSMQMRPSAGKGGSSMRNVAGNSVCVAMSSRDSQVDSQKKEDTVSTSSSPDSVVTQRMVRPDNVEMELPQLLHDLQAIALNPFNNVERNPEIILEVFLRFRALVYQKSLPADNESNGTGESKSPAVAAASDAPAETIRELQPMKPQKSVLRPDDPAKGGLKRGQSDLQEEIVAKKKKKIHEVKIATAEKRPAQKTPVMQRGDGKETRSPTMKSTKPESAKKAEPPSRAPDPTMLVMKFPTQGTLPSIMELKARFVRFGQLDHSATRVFWKSSTCRVVFRHKADAQSALRFAVASSNLFGNTGVRCYLRDLEVAAPEVESAKVRREEASTMGMPQSRDSAVERRSAAPLASQSQQQPGIQLKSILKKSTGEETGGNGGGRGTPRVKFMLGGEESSKGKDQLMIGNKNSNNNATFADGGTSSTTTTHEMDFNSKNFQKVISTTNALPPLLPLPISAVQFPRQPNNLNYSEVSPRNVHNFNIPSEQPMAPSAPNVDIAHQMINLLTRCNDIVTNVTGMLGYVPYHPL